MDSQHDKTPIGEAISLISIASLLLGVCCFVGASENVAFVVPALLWVAEQVYRLFPALSYLNSPQMPMVAAALAVGGGFFVLAIGFAPLLARLFNSSQMAEMDRQTAKLKRNRARITQARRDRDNFNVS